jgi:hypothetical protein
MEELSFDMPIHISIYANTVARHFLSAKPTQKYIYLLNIVTGSTVSELLRPALF